MLREKLKSGLRGAVTFVGYFCFACAVCVLGVCFDGREVGARHFGLTESQKGLLLIAYALASAGVALWIATNRWLGDGAASSREEA